MAIDDPIFWTALLKIIGVNIVLSGDNAAAYADQVRVGFGSMLPDGMKRIAAALVRAESATGQ
jgi:hypothetical protein